MSTNQSNVNPAPAAPSLPSADEEAIMAAIAMIRQKLSPVLIDLTPAERKGLAKLGDKGHGFVMKAVDVAMQNPDVIPGSHSVEDVRNTAHLFQSMAGIRIALQQLYKQIHDTTTKVGSDAYAVARAIYAGTKSPVAGPHLKTAADDLAKRFERKPKVAAAEAPTVGNAGTTPSATASAASSMTPPTPHA